jgi:hypothetical protein
MSLCIVDFRYSVHNSRATYKTCCALLTALLCALVSAVTSVTVLYTSVGPLYSLLNG